MDESLIKDAFSRAKQDISSVKEDLMNLSHEISSIRQLLEDIKTSSTDKPAINQIQQTDLTELSEQDSLNSSFKVLKPHVYKISTGNRGVPTNRQTNQQTVEYPNTSTGELETSDLTSFVNSLDTIKKDIRNKFKRLTKQEMVVFSSIYELEEGHFDVDYPLISKRLSLSESSIRDYVQKIVKKGVPIIKIRENNKKIYLKISPDLKKIASLPTLLQLREI